MSYTINDMPELVEDYTDMPELVETDMPELVEVGFPLAYLSVG